jgi:hypothetical protein
VHVLWHLIPRYPGEEEGPKGTALLAMPPPLHEPPDVSAQVAAHVRAAIHTTARPPEPAPAVRGFLRLTGAAQRVMLYDPLVRRWRPARPRDPQSPAFPAWVERLLERWGHPRPKRRAADVATLYVGLWLFALLVLAAVTFVTPGWWLLPVVAVLAAMRTVDVASFQLRYLLDRNHSMHESFERSLLLLGVNVAEMVLALTVLLTAWVDRAPGTAIREAFGIVTLTDAPATPEAGAFILRIIFTVVSIALLAGAGGVILGLVGRDVEEAPHGWTPRGISSDDGTSKPGNGDGDAVREFL